MKYRVIYAPLAERDLARIREWIAAESRDPMIADRFLRELFEACEELETFPERFPLYPFAKRWRMMPFGNYLVFFQVHEQEVRIGLIRHGARKPFRA